MWLFKHDFELRGGVIKVKEEKLTQDLETAEEQAQDTGDELNEEELEAVAGGRLRREDLRRGYL